LSRKPQRSGLFHGFWYTLTGLKIERVKRSEYGEAYRLYALGTRYGLTERSAGTTGARIASEHPARLRSVSSYPAAREANPFH